MNGCLRTKLEVVPTDSIPTVDRVVYAYAPDHKMKIESVSSELCVESHVRFSWLYL